MNQQMDGSLIFILFDETTLTGELIVIHQRMDG